MRAALMVGLISVATASGFARDGLQGPVALGAVTGEVVDATSGRRLEFASVSVTCAGVRSTVLSDPAGRFAFTRIPIPNVCHLTVSRAGYLDGAYGGGDQGLGGGLPVASRWTGGVRLIMRRPAGIAGRLVDGRGQAVVGAFARVLRELRVGGRLEWGSGHFAKSDDRGDFRVAGLPPGRYVLLASGKGLVAPPAGGRDRVYRSTYFPSETDISRAQVIQVKAADEVNVGVFVLGYADSVSVRGRVVTDICPSAPGRGFAVTARPAGDEVAGVGASAVQVRSASDGSFQFRDLPAGRYTVSVGLAGREFIAETSGMSSPVALPGFLGGGIRGGGWETFTPGVRIQYEHAAEAPGCYGQLDVDLTVHPQDIVVNVLPAASIEGRVSVSGGLSWPLDTGTYLYVATARSGLETEVRASGEFRLAGVPPGEEQLRVRILGKPTTAVQAVYWKGQDVTDVPMVVNTADRISGVVIQLSDEIPRLRGRVTASSGRLPARTAVLAYPVDPILRQDPASTGWVTVDAAGRFDLWRSQIGKPFRPAAYYVTALREDQLQYWDDEAFLASVTRLAKNVALSWGHTAEVDVVLPEP